MSNNNSSFELSGMEELLNKLEALGAKSANIEKKALEKAGEVLEKEMKSNVPRDTGKLRDSIQVSKVKKTKKDGRVIWVGDVSKETDYAWSVEFGHVAENGKQVPANPFMSRSFQSKENEMQEIIKQQIREGLGLN